VSWRVRLHIDDAGAVLVHAVDVSLHGLRLAIKYAVASRLLRRGRRYRLEVELPNPKGGFTRTGEVRHIGEHGVGLETIEALPALLIDEAAARLTTDRRPLRSRNRSA
jgi:PilZ domain-containing protein